MKQQKISDFFFFRSMLGCFIFFYLTVFSVFAYAENKPALVQQVELQRAISFEHYPVVVRGADVSSLKGVDHKRIGVLSVKRSALQPVVFQVDARDEKGQFVIDSNGQASNTVFDANDELVFLAKDAGERLETGPLLAGVASFVEIKLSDPVSGMSRWVYVAIYHSNRSVQASAQDIHYDSLSDTIYSDTYRLRFAKQTPFLVNTFNWADDINGGWHPDMVDQMKVRHTGKLFGLLPFVRTHGDYESKLIAVKEGAVRVIRRTVNRVRILWHMQTPEIVIDYVAYPNVVFMDTHIDLPFRLGRVLKDIKTLTTIDWNNTEALLPLKIFSESMPEGIAVDGMMGVADERFNHSGDHWLVIKNNYGSVLTGLVLDEALPVTRRVYLKDSITSIDPPEEMPGQFGNVGYVSDHWDKVDIGLQHMVLGFYVVRDISPADGLRVLQHAPWDR